MDVDQVGTSGTSGTNGTTAGASGGPGGLGGAESLTNTGNGTDTTNSTEAIGGAGGTGGSGGSGSPAGGAAGPGGTGGGSSASTTVTLSTGTDQVFATANGGYGGAAGGPGNSNTSSSGAGASGGAGGTATANAGGADAGGPVFSHATSTGGRGGSSIGPGGSGGAGGVASATRATGSGTGVYAYATQIGGAGGNGYVGATGGVGAASTLANAVGGITSGSYLRLQQAAVGGAGGYSSGGAGGAAGAGSSTLSVDDTANPVRASTVTGTSSASGGTGGSGLTAAAAGGTAAATISLAGANTVNATATGRGGAGGSDRGSAGAGGAGGAVSGASASGTTTSSSAQASASASAIAGGGGSASGAGQTGGAGGVASGSTAVASGHSASASVYQAGGSGGGGGSGVTGGAGAASTLSNAVSGATTGGTLRLVQTARGGAGGSADTGGAGGLANSSLTASDATGASSVYGGVSAYGGSGGSGTASAAAGAAAVATIALTGSNGVDARDHATGGAGGRDYGTTNGAVGGTATTTAAGTSTGTGSTFVNGYAYARGGNGGGAYGTAGNGGAGGAAVSSAGTAVAASSTGNRAYGYVREIGGSGGRGTGAGAVGGAGGAATGASATARGFSARDVVISVGGAGGAATAGATGGAGAGVTLSNAATASSGGGYISLRQAATGGAGGNGYSGGAGGAAGAASATLAFDDTGSAVQASSLSAQDQAYGGAGGGGTTPTQGGSATGSLILTGVNGVNASTTTRGGIGGAGYGTATGAVGGAASSTATASSSTTIAGVYASTRAAGGAGGNIFASSGTGGVGGTVAASTAVATDSAATGGRAQATAYATGGAGGRGTGTGQSGGAGAVVSGVTAQASGRSAYASVTQVGGGGGNGYNGASGGAGAASTLTNAVNAATTGGTLRLTQAARGGRGGVGVGGGAAGAAGAASSSLSFNDILANTTAAASLYGRAAAYGGYGGTGGTPTTGGTAVATDTMTGSNTVGATSLALGGVGGSGYGSVAGAAGGRATATATTNGMTTGSGGGTASATARGGAGGASGNAGSGGAGGAGGAATGVTARASENTATAGRAYSYASQTGGTGGRGYGAGNTGGAGGTATSTVGQATGFSAVVRVQQTGGSGGGASNGATGGLGASSSLTNAAIGSTLGGYLRLYQAATGGSGGSSQSGAGGAAGSASSVLTGDETTSPTHASSFYGVTRASGGSGGGGTTPTVGGSATAITALVGPNNVNATASAFGGTGGAGYGTSDGAAGGAATTTSASARSSGTGSSLIAATATAAGGAGGSAFGTQGNGGAGGAASPASATATNTALTSGRAQATATTNGGAGGRATGTGMTGGAGAVVSGTTAKASGYSAYASVYQTGGAGGSGYGGASGGAGAASTLTNAATGTATGGDLILRQRAAGGAGGSTNLLGTAGNAGAAGAAISSLAASDTTSSFLYTTSNAYGGAGGRGAAPTAGATAGASAAASGANYVSARSNAVGGLGGAGTSIGGTGGAATASATATSSSTAAANVTAIAQATGGQGSGTFYYNTTRTGGAGGAATGGTAISMASGTTGGRAYAEARQSGGTGGRAYGSGQVGGAGGVASSTSATATGFSATVSATQVGGAGGYGISGAAGGAGAASTLTNAVSGTTRGGYLQLGQTATGGYGGFSQGTGSTGGTGGGASSSLAFDDGTNPVAADAVTATSTAYGGRGGAGATEGSGGAASAALTLSGAYTLSGSALAMGGAGGSGAGAGGNATANSLVTATSDQASGTASSRANATGGSGALGTATASATAITAHGQAASASATGTGSSGVVTTAAISNGAGLVTQIEASTQAGLDGTEQAESDADIGTNTFGYAETSRSDYAFATAEPGSAFVNLALAGNDAVAAQLGTGQADVALVGFQGGYVMPGSTGPQEYLSSQSVTLDATGLQGELYAGLLGSESFGAGFDTLGFSVSVSGAVVVQQSFTSLGDAQAYFDDNALDLGAVTPVAGLVVTFSLDLVASSTGDGFGEEFMLGATGGNGPPVIAAPNTATTVQGQASAVPGLMLEESGNTDGLGFTVTLSDTTGLLSATGPGVVGAGSTSLTLTGSLDQVNAALSTVTALENAATLDTLRLAAIDSLGGHALNEEIALAVTGVPEIAAPASATVGLGLASAVHGITLSEAGATAGETFSVTISDTNGLLSATGADGNGTPSITFGGSLDQVNAVLATLTDTDSSAAPDTLVLDATDSNGGAATEQSIAVTVAAGPVITSPAAVTVGKGQAVAIGGISLSEDGASAGETFSVTLSDANGLLAASGPGVTGSGTTTLTVGGTLAQVNAALATLTDTDGTPSPDTIAIAATDGFGIAAGGRSVAVAVNGAPQINASSTATLTQGQAGALSVGLFEGGNTAGEAFRITLTDTAGLLSATGAGITGSGSTSLTISGALGDVQTALGTLMDTEATPGSDSVTATAVDGFGNGAGPVVTSVLVQPALMPVLAAPAALTVGIGKAATISGISLAETGAQAGESFTVTLSDTNGALSAPGAFGIGGNAIEISGSLAQVNASLAGVTDTDAVLGSDTITIAASDSLGNTATARSVAVTVAPVPAIAAPAAIVLGQAHSGTITGVSLSEPGAAAGETFSVTLSDNNGHLSASGAGVTGSGSTTLVVSGSLAQVNADLATLSDNDPTAVADTIAISATDSFGNTATPASIAVTVNPAPVLSVSSPTGLRLGEADPVSASLSEGGNTTDEGFTVTLTDTHGGLAATGSGITGSGSTALTLTGSLAQVQADLATLTDTDTTVGPDSIALVATDSFGNASTSSIAVTAFRTAVPALGTAPPLVVHVGDTVLPGLVIANTALADGDSEELIANAVMPTGTAAITPTGSTGDILPGGQGTLGLQFSTTTAGVISSTVTYDAVSDGNPVDGRGQLDLGNNTATVQVTVDNFARPVLEHGTVLLPSSANTYTLDFGTVLLGGTDPSAAIAVGNAAAAPGDSLNGAIALIATDGAFANTGFGTVGTVAASSALGVGTIVLETSTAGTFSETFQLNTTGFNPSGYSASRPVEFLTVRGIVAPAMAPTSPTTPVGPTHPTTPTHPTAPTHPTMPTQPTAPTQPTTPTQPTMPTHPTAPTHPTMPTHPTTPTAPTHPTAPTSPTHPTAPTSPTHPTTPTSPTSPTAPTAPSNPTSPTGPTFPTTPSEPTSPTFPTTPSEPTSPTFPTSPTAPTSPTVPTGPTGNGDGDTHLTTFDKLHYDFQAAGEFVYAKNADIEVQVRLEPSGGPQHPSGAVTYIVQTAIGLGADRLTFDFSRAQPFWLDGTPVTLLSGQFLPLTNGTVYGVSGGFVVVANTGEHVRLSAETTTVSLGGHTTGVQGLLGNANGDPSQDLALPDGTVLQQPLTFDQLYTTFADAWRVTQATSLFDYGPGETTATYTIANFPPHPVTLADLPDSVVQAAQQYIASLGITNATQQADAVLDYVLGGGSPTTLASDANPAAAQSTTSLGVTGGPPVELLGIAGPVGPVSIGAGTTSVSFTVFLNTARSDDVVVTYAVPGATSIDQLGAADFGGTLPSGTVTIPAGATSATFTIAVPGDLRLPVEMLSVGISSSALDLTLANNTGGATLDSTIPVEGVDAIPVLVQTSGPGTLSQVGQTYTLDLGTIGSDGVPASALLIDNIAAGDGNTLGGSFTTPTGSGFTITRPGSVAGIRPGSSQGGLSVSASTALGSHSETLTFTPTQANSSGFSGTLAPITIIVTDTVVPPTAQPASTPGTIAVTARLGGASTGSLTVGNASPIGSDSLGVTLTELGGHVLPAETSALAPGAQTSLSLNSVARTSGTFTDTLGVAYSSIAPSGSGHATAPDGGTTIELDGTVYQPAAAALQTTSIDFGTVHQGDPIPVASIVLGNTVAPGALSDSLVATASTVPPGLVDRTAGTTGVTIAPGGTGTLSVGFDTSRPGVFSGTETIALASHDAALADSSLGSVTVSITGTVVGDAEPSFVEVSGPGTLTTQANGNAVIDLGVLQPGSATETLVIAVANAALAPADSLAGSLTFSAQGFSTALAPFSGMAPGAQSGSYTFTVSPNTPGQVMDTITLMPTDSVEGALPTQTLTLEAQVACFLRGTRILTTRGEVPVEELRLGEPVVTVLGQGAVLKPVTWIGRSAFDAPRHPRPHEAWPVRIRADALADGVPSRDLLVSPGHALLVDGVLVQAERLVNGVTIVQDRAVPRGEYFHVEVEGHDVLLAEGAPAETYLDVGNRHVFEGVNGIRTLHADFSADGSWPGRVPRQPCVPLVCEGPVLVAAKTRLLGRVRAAGFVGQHDPGLHLLTVSGQVVAPEAVAGRRYRFLVPSGVGLRLASRVWVPSQHDAASTDLRELGVCVARLLLDDVQDVPLASLGGGEGRPGGGWHAGESGWRWTDGRALLPAATRSITVELGGSATYWASSEAAGHGRRASAS